MLILIDPHNTGIWNIQTKVLWGCHFTKKFRVRTDIPSFHCTYVQNIDTTILLLNCCSLGQWHFTMPPNSLLESDTSTSSRSSHRPPTNALAMVQIWCASWDHLYSFQCCIYFYYCEQQAKNQQKPWAKRKKQFPLQYKRTIRQKYQKQYIGKMVFLCLICTTGI